MLEPRTTKGDNRGKTTADNLDIGNFEILTEFGEPAAPRLLSTSSWPFRTKRLCYKER
jgi:hypothetical protein